MNRTSEIGPPGTSGRPIAREIAFGFALVSLIAVSMCLMLLALLNDVADEVQTMRHEESTIRGSLELAAAVREQYIHMAHSMVSGDDSHVEHYAEWVNEVERSIEGLKLELPASEHPRLDEIGEASAEMDEIFRAELLPVLSNGNPAARRAANAKVERHAEYAARQADTVVRAAERHMADAHSEATSITKIGLVSTLGCVGLVLIFSIGWTVRIQRSLVTPLQALADAAEKVGRGGFHARVGSVGPRELRVVGSAMDRMAQELELREKRVVEAERMAAIGELAAAVAHELNNPIGIIRGYLKTMSSETDPKTLDEELAILDEEAAACERITSDLLAYSRTGDSEMAEVSARELVSSSVERLEQDAAFGGYSLRVAAEDGPIVVDAERVRQVIANLLRNAAQASSPGSELRVEGAAVGDEYVVRVLDRGAGIPPEAADRLFEPFVSFGTGGTGLGLAVCQRIVEQHGGQITLGERPGGGSVAQFTLPVDQRTLEDVVG